MLFEFHSFISNKITNFLNSSYFDNLKKLYNEPLDKVFKYCNFPIIKPEYFVYSQYYFIYTFIYYLNKNTVLYSISLHLIFILDSIFQNICIHNNYSPQSNIYFLKDMSYSLMMYLFYLKICFHHINYVKKIILISLCSAFYMGYRVNHVYKKRLISIENNSEFIDEFKILIISPDIKLINRIINITRFFTYGNYLFFINILLFLLY